MLHEDQAEVRRHMIWVLEHCGDAGSLPTLGKVATQDADTETRIMAITAMGHMREPAALAYLAPHENDDTGSAAYAKTVGQAATSAQQTLEHSRRTTKDG